VNSLIEYKDTLYELQVKVFLTKLSGPPNSDLLKTHQAYHDLRTCTIYFKFRHTLYSRIKIDLYELTIELQLLWKSSVIRRLRLQSLPSKLADIVTRNGVICRCHILEFNSSPCPRILTPWNYNTLLHWLWKYYVIRRLKLQSLLFRLVDIVTRNGVIRRCHFNRNLTAHLVRESLHIAFHIQVGKCLSLEFSVPVLSSSLCLSPLSTPSPDSYTARLLVQLPLLLAHIAKRLAAESGACSSELQQV
jgi:hypothetical protein